MGERRAIRRGSRDAGRRDDQPQWLEGDGHRRLEDDRRTAETLLKREGAEVVTATDGFEALAKIADNQPQIIFVDIMMPRLDGYQTCALIKNNQMFKSTPVIMLSPRTACSTKHGVASSVPSST
jgi:CheY-like chemotaxis protein